MGDERANRIDVARVERLARDLIMGFGLPVELVAVRHEAPHWLVIVREASRQIQTIELPDTSTVAQLRGLLKDRLMTGG